MTRVPKPFVSYLILLLLVVLPLFSLGLFNHGLCTADEPGVAEIGREMALSGNWAVPTLNGAPFLEEPPLYYGALATAFKVFGGPSGVIFSFLALAGFVHGSGMLDRYMAGLPE